MSKTTTTTKTIRIPALTQQQLADKLRSLKGATFVTLVTKTVPNMRVAGNPFRDKVFKVSRVNGTINFIYGNSVNRQRGREGKVADFQPEPRKWGTRIEGTPLVEHKGYIYLEMKVENALGHSFLWSNGNSMSADEAANLTTYLFESYQPKTQQTDKEITLRDYALKSIVAITIDGTQFVIVPM